MQRYAIKSILRVLWRPSWISSKYYCYTYKKKMEPYFFLKRSYSEPESVAKSILTNKKSEITNGPALKATNSLTWSGDETVDIDSCSAEMSERYFVSRRVATCSMPTRIVVPGSSKWCDLMSITWHSRNVLPSLLCTWCAPVNDSARSYTLIYIDLSTSTHCNSTGTSAGFWLGRSIPTCRPRRRRF